MLDRLAHEAERDPLGLDRLVVVDWRARRRSERLRHGHLRVPHPEDPASDPVNPGTHPQEREHHPMTRDVDSRIFERVSPILARLPPKPGRARTTSVTAPLEPVTKSVNRERGSSKPQPNRERPVRESLDRETKTHRHARRTASLTAPGRIRATPRSDPTIPHVVTDRPTSPHPGFSGGCAFDLPRVQTLR